MAAKYLKKNKAPGIDGISPIALKLFNNHLILFMTSFFNKDKVYPEVWCSGLIKPVIYYKKGDRKILATTEETLQQTHPIGFRGH